MLQDFQDVGMLLNRDNIDREALLLYAKEAADLATENKIPSLDFALNHRGQEDAAIFDFTSMHQAEHSSMIFEREGKKLLMAIVGDTLIEVTFKMKPAKAKLAKTFFFALNFLCFFKKIFNSIIDTITMNQQTHAATLYFCSKFFVISLKKLPFLLFTDFQQCT